MKTPEHFIFKIMKPLSLLLFFALVACQPTEHCDAVTDIEGKYTGAGECVRTDKDGKRIVSTVAAETDIIERYPEAKESLYQVAITGGDGFHELEIGALTGKVLYTATAEVSDTTYPVLEQYIFEVDESCKAVGFTKVVRNPDPDHFKACVIYCKKVD